MAIVTSKPQTTRNRICGIRNRGESQFVFVDTPGLHKARTRLGDYMVNVVKESVSDVDAVLLVVEPIPNVGEPEKQLIQRMKTLNCPAVLAINKADTLPQKDKLLEVIRVYSREHDFDAVVPISAKTGQGVEELLDVLEGCLPEGPQLFPEDMTSDQPERQMMAEILKIGVPTLTFQVLTSVSIALINRAASNYGDAVIAGMGAVTRVTSMGTLVVFGFLKGFQPIAGFSYGAKKFDRLKEAIRRSTIWSTIFCVITGLFMAIFSTQIISAFTDGNAEMISVGASSLRANGISFILFGFYTVYSSLLLALGKGAAGFFLGACRQGICFVPVILLLPALCGLNGILYAQPIADAVSAIITVLMAIRLHRELAKSALAI